MRPQLRFGVLVPQDRVSSVPLPGSALPSVAIPVLASQVSDGRDPKLVEALLLHPLRIREAEMEDVSSVVKDDVGHAVSVAALVAAPVTGSHDPVPVSAIGPSSSFRCPARPTLWATLLLISRSWVIPVVGLLLNVIRGVNTYRLGAKVSRFCSFVVPSCVSSVIVHGILVLMGVPWYSFMCLLAKPSSSCAIRLAVLLVVSWLILTAIWRCLALLSRPVPLLCWPWFTLVARIVWSGFVSRLLTLAFSWTLRMRTMEPWRSTAIFWFAVSHEDMWTVYEMACLGRGLASPCPFLGAPAGSPGQVKHTGAEGRGAWHLPSLVLGAMLGSLLSGVLNRRLGRDISTGIVLCAYGMAGVRSRAAALSLRSAMALMFLGLSGLGAWHPPALSRVPYTMRASSCLCGCSGVVGTGGLASPIPFLGAVHAAGFLVTVLLFGG